MNRLLTFLTPVAAPLLFGWGAVEAAAQQLSSPPPRENPADLALDSNLFQVERLARTQSLATPRLQQQLLDRGVRMDDRRRIHVHVRGPEGGAPISDARLLAVGAEADARALNQVDAWVPIDRLSTLARSLPKGHFVYPIEPLRHDNEGPGVINSDSYRDGGANGAGMTVAVIDGGYFSLSAVRGAGAAPPLANTTLINYTGNSFESGGVHGTACVETVFDHVPGALFRIYKIDSPSDLTTVVNNCQANGVEVITHSLSWYNMGWADNSGTPCAAANDASNSGILFFTSAGNRAQQHWQGNFNSGTSGVDWHDWVTGDQSLAISVPAGNACPFYLSWNTAGGTFDYDLYIYDATGTVVLASSTNPGNTFESLTWTNVTGSTQTINLAVFRRSGGVTTMEAFMHGGGTWQQYASSSNSTTSPSNATGAQVLPIGAVAYTSYDQGNGSNPIASYSSRGPTNGGVFRPALCGPTNTTTVAYGGSFGGTSCATPNACGATLAFWDGDPQLDGIAVRFLIREQADLWRDWGLNGADQTYGLGGLFFTDFRPGTIWLTTSNRFNNPGNVRHWPQNLVAWAQAYAPSGGRLAFLPGGSYPPAVTLFKALRVESFGADAVVGN